MTLLPKIKKIHQAISEKRVVTNGQKDSQTDSQTEGQEANLYSQNALCRKYNRIYKILDGDFRQYFINYARPAEETITYTFC